MRRKPPGKATVDGFEINIPLKFDRIARAVALQSIDHGSVRRQFSLALRAGIVLIVLLITPLISLADWRQAAGPSGNFHAEGTAPAKFSVARNENVLWRSPLPSTGQGTVIICNGRAFVTSHELQTKNEEMGSTILGLCFDAATGKELWRREIPGTRNTDLSSLFSDNTAASPVANDDSVCFVNVGGTMKCFDFNGKEKWSHTWTPFGRHHARMHEPIHFGDSFIFMFTPRYDLDLAATTKAGARLLGRGKDVFSYLQAFDCKTGKRVWKAKSPTSIHSTSILGETRHGNVILTGRGGGHQPPEEPYGVSLVNAADGNTIWDLPIKNYPAAQNACFNENVACLFAGKEHIAVDIATGKIKSRVSIVDDVSVFRFEDGKYEMKPHQSLRKIKKAITNQSNCLVGDYHYFLAHDDFLIGRVNIKTNTVEYLHVPVQVVRRPKHEDEVRWVKALPNDMKTANGFTATQDKRNAGNGWGHVSAASPTVIGDKIYFPTMIGMVYVLNWQADQLNDKALVSISDLGPAGETWSLSSLSFNDGKIYARTLKEIICIGR